MTDIESLIKVKLGLAMSDLIEKKKDLLKKSIYLAETSTMYLKFLLGSIRHKLNILNVLCFSLPAKQDIVLLLFNENTMNLEIPPNLCYDYYEALLAAIRISLRHKVREGI